MDDAIDTFMTFLTTKPLVMSSIYAGHVLLSISTYHKVNTQCHIRIVNVRFIASSQSCVLVGMYLHVYY